MAGKPQSEARRLATIWSKVDRRGPSECWEWKSFKTPAGYGRVQWMENGKKRCKLAHRFFYELSSEVPIGLELDHLCRNRACVNPHHLEPVTHQENVRRGRSGEPQKAKTHCPRGHAYTEANTYLKQRGKYTERHCRKCLSMHSMAYQKRNPEKKAQIDRAYRERLQHADD